MGPADDEDHVPNYSCYTYAGETRSSPKPAIRRETTRGYEDRTGRRCLDNPERWRELVYERPHRGSQQFVRRHLDVRREYEGEHHEPGAFVWLETPALAIVPEQHGDATMALPNRRCRRSIAAASTSSSASG
jgi:hypothetical protein